MTQEALKLALDALEYWDVHGKLHQPTEEAITAIKEALAQTQEPVATLAVRWHDPVGKVAYVLEVNLPVGIHKLYTSPPRRTWVGLTDQEISELIRATHNTGSFVRAIEAKLKEKNT